MAGRGLLFQVVPHHDDMVNSESVVDVTPGDSGVVIRYQVDEFIFTWSVEYFIAQSDIYASFMGNVSMLIYSTPEQGCEDYSFLDQALEDFEHIFILSSWTLVNTTKLDTSFDVADTMPSSVSSGFLHLIKL